MSKGFTLIELLIVVAIIAILAAIAVPNFLEAQVRAKVSRSKTDMRTLATAIESYSVDNNSYPTDAGNGQSNIFRPYGNGGAADPRANFSIGFELTTPIAYLSTTSAMIDPFKMKELHRYTGNLSGRQYYNYANWKLREKAGNTNFRTTIGRVGNWIIMGAGPDMFVNNVPGGTDFSNANNIPRGRNYDPTNGTVSNGDIYRCQKQAGGMVELTNP